MMKRGVFSLLQPSQNDKGGFMKRAFIGCGAVFLAIGVFASAALAAEVTVGKQSIAIPESIDGDELALVQKYAPQIPKLCPRFKKYESELNSFSIENNYYIDILFTVPENSSIPTEFMVHGHTCYLEISKDGKYLVVPKRACQSLCLGKDMNDSSGDLKIPLE